MSALSVRGWRKKWSGSISTHRWGARVGSLTKAGPSRRVQCSMETYSHVFEPLKVRVWVRVEPCTLSHRLLEISHLPVHVHLGNTGHPQQMQHIICHVRPCCARSRCLQATKKTPFAVSASDYGDVLLPIEVWSKYGYVTSQPTRRPYLACPARSSGDRHRFLRLPGLIALGQKVCPSSSGLTLIRWTLLKSFNIPRPASETSS